MKAFEYARPATAAEAVELLAEAGGRAEVLGGGTDLLALMKDRVREPDRLVGVAGVAELRGVEATADGGLRIGASNTLAELAAQPDLGSRYPAVARAIGEAAGPQIRNLGTLGGNLCQRPRCWYFRLGYGLLPTRDGTSMIRAGDNRYHAILGNDGDALFVSPSTVVPILIALGAEVTVRGPSEEGSSGERTVPLGDFYRIPTDEGMLEYDLSPGQLVTAVTLPPADGWRAASYEVRPGKGLDWSLSTTAVALRMEGDRVGEARVVLGQVAPKPWRAGRSTPRPPRPRRRRRSPGRRPCPGTATRSSSPGWPPSGRCSKPPGRRAEGCLETEPRSTATPAGASGPRGCSSTPRRTRRCRAATPGSTGASTR